MTCAFPPELDEIQLMAFLDEAASEAVRTHLDNCPHCQARAAALNQTQLRLAHGLYRATCPEPGILGDYHFENLAAERQTHVARHLAACPHCTQELNQLQTYLQALAPGLRPSRLAEAKFSLAQRLSGLAEGLQSGLAAPALAGVRGQTDAAHVYQAADIQIAIQITADKDHPDRKTLFGLLNSAALNGAPVFLWNDQGELLAQSTVPETAQFSFENLTPQAYTLILGSPPVEIHLNLLIE